MTTAKPLPAVDFLKIPETGDPYLEALKCKNCNSIYLGARAVCSKCGARDQLAAYRLGTKGKLYAYSIVHRSFPGVEVPYISAIVDLEGGGTLKGNRSEEPEVRHARRHHHQGCRTQRSGRQFVSRVFLSTPRCLRR